MDENNSRELNKTISHDSTSPRKIRKCSVNKAVELIIKHNAERKRKRRKVTDTNNDKVTHHCKSYQGQRRERTSIVGFSKSLVLSEMQSCIARQDWKQASNLFLRLVEYPVELEPVVWRCAMIILLHTDDPSHLRQFFEQCIGSHGSNNSALLKRLLLLPLNE